MELKSLAGPDELAWKTSRFCASGECVRVASGGETIFLGDSKDPSGPVIAYTHAEWHNFVAKVRLGDFDLLQL
jgi:hypothetical protein